MTSSHHSIVLFASDDPTEFFLFLGVVFAIWLLVQTFKNPRLMYWLGLVALHFQALFFLFQLPKILELVNHWQPNHGGPPVDFWSDGQRFGLLVAILPFLLPLAAAALTGAIAERPIIAVASFTFWSLVQVLLHGQRSGQNVGERVGPIIKYAVPVLSLLINLLRAYNEGR